MDDKVTNEESPQNPSTDPSEDSYEAPVVTTADEPELEVEPLTITDKIVGVFAEPGEIFKNLKEAGPRATDWVVPMTLLIVVAGLLTVIRFNDPEFVNMIYEQQARQMESQVESGSMTAEQAEAAMEQMRGMGTGLFLAFGLGGVVIGIPVVLLLRSLVYLLTLKIFKGQTTFQLIFAAVGLVTYISIVEMIAGTVIGYALGNPFASFSPAAFMEYDATNKMYLFMSHLNPITIYGLFVLSIAFEKIAEITRGNALIVSYGTWAIWVIVSVLAGFQVGGM